MQIRSAQSLNCRYRNASQVKAQGPEQINGGDAVFDRHPVTALQNHWLTTGQQHHVVSG